MDHRTRFLNSIRGGRLDRFFRYELGIWPSTRELWLAQGLPPEVGCYHDSPGFAEHFGFDPVIRIGVKSGYTDSPWYPDFEKETLEEDEEHLTFRDADGIVKRVLKERGDTSMPQFVGFPVAGEGDWKKAKERLDPADAGKRIGDLSALAAKCADPTLPTLLPICGAFGHPRNLLGDEGLAYALYDSPGLIDDILDNWYELYARLITCLTGSLRVDSLLIWEDMCYKNGPLIAPEQFRRFMLPHYWKLIRLAKDCGIKCVLVDSDGDVLKMIPIFLEAGVDGLMPFEVQAGMDVTEIRKRFGASFCVMGGLDKRALAAGPAEIEAEVNRVLPCFLESGRFIPTLDHTVPTDVSLENFRTYLKCLRSFEGGTRWTKT
jgi:hypothetical protein